jgi:hypothetical protein
MVLSLLVDMVRVRCASSQSGTTTRGIGSSTCAQPNEVDEGVLGGWLLA